MIVSLDLDALRLVDLDPDGIMTLCDIGVLRRSSERMRKVAISEEARFYGADSPTYQRCTRPEGSPLLYARFEFPSGTLEVPCLRVDVRKAVKSEHREYVDYGDFQLTDAGRSLAEIVSPCTSIDVGKYIELGYELIGKRESEMLSEGAFCERDFDRAVDKSISRLMKRR